MSFPVTFLPNTPNTDTFFRRVSLTYPGREREETSGRKRKAASGRKETSPHTTYHPHFLGRRCAPARARTLESRKTPKQMVPEVLSCPLMCRGRRVSTPRPNASRRTPFPTLPQVQAVIAAASANMNRCADMAATDLVADIALFHEWPDTGIAVGNGSTALIEKILQAVTTPGGEIVIPQVVQGHIPTVIQAAAAGGRRTRCAWGSPRLAGDGSGSDAADAGGDGLLPNNPTGTAVTHSRIFPFSCPRFRQATMR